MSKLLSLSNSKNTPLSKWEVVPEGSPLAKEFELILWARRSESIDLIEGKQPSIGHDSSLKIEWNPVKLRRRKDGELVDVNHLDKEARAAVDEIRAKVTVSLEEFFHRLADRNGNLD